MKIGVIAGSIRYYGFKDKKISDSNLKAICDLMARNHEVTLLTAVQFIEPKPDALRYEPDSIGGKFDLIVMMNMLSDVFIHTELFRNLYVLLTHESDRYLEVVIDSNFSASRVFKYLNEVTDGKRFYDQQKLAPYLSLMSERNRRYAMEVERRAAMKPRIVEQYEQVFNCSSGQKLVFPFTLFDHAQIRSWSVTKPMIMDARNVYIGSMKPARLRKLVELGIPTALYCDKDFKPKNGPRLDNNGRLLMSKLPSVFPGYRTSAVTVEPAIKHTGWILRRIVESVHCGTPALVHENLLHPSELIYGFTTVGDHHWFHLNDEEMTDWYQRLSSASEREELVAQQDEVLRQVEADFEREKEAKLEMIFNAIAM